MSMTVRKLLSPATGEHSGVAIGHSVSIGMFLPGLWPSPGVGGSEYAETLRKRAITVAAHIALKVFIFSPIFRDGKKLQRRDQL
jgi:hypothetical protein